MSTAELTINYIKEHPYIKHCLKEGLINYSSLARQIVRDLDVKDSTTKDAILVAARRYAERLRDNKSNERHVLDFLHGCETEIKNKLCIIVISKPASISEIDDVQKIILEDHGLIFFMEGADFYKVLIQEKYASLVLNAFKGRVIKELYDLVMIKIKMPKHNEAEVGLIAYVSSLFAESDISIIDFMSCWTDMNMVIESKHLKKAIDFLKF